MNILIEIFCEEIPARMQKDAQEHGQKLSETLLTSFGLTYSQVECFVSTRRIALIMKGVPEATEEKIEVRRGPRVSAPTAALEGFLKSVYMTKDQLDQKEDYYFAKIIHKAQKVADMMPQLLNGFLDQFSWPKAMVWHLEKTQGLTRSWVRPIRHIICLVEDQVVECDVKGLDKKTSNITKGHRFLSTKTLCIKNAKTYVEQLRDEKVIVCFQERRAAIEKQLVEQSKALGLTIKADEGLLDEVAGLIDFPFVHIGAIPDQFMQLPFEVISTSMRVHQKYFTLLNADGSLANRFAVVTNVPMQPDKRLMMDGFERVLTARLSDAQFFYTTDVKTPLENLCEQYNKIIFHEKIGTIRDKINRLIFMIENLVDILGFDSQQIQNLKRAALLCKADLLTTMVGEFPELQGTMGRIYATAQGEDAAVSDALQNHYQPLGPSKPVPVDPVSRILALLDKVDTLVGFLGNDIKPTGSKDPLAIRRTALGIIRLLVEDETGSRTLSQNPITNDFLLKFLESSVKAYKTQSYHLGEGTIETVKAFMQTRYEHYLKEE